MFFIHICHTYNVLVNNVSNIHTCLKEQCIIYFNYSLCFSLSIIPYRIWQECSRFPPEQPSLVCALFWICEQNSVDNTRMTFFVCLFSGEAVLWDTKL